MLSFTESEQSMRSTTVAAPTARDVVVADGRDAATYLHGQLSQNVEGLAEGSSAWSLLLEPTGRVTSWLRITRVGAETFWLDVDCGTGAPTLARLDRFKLRTEATFELRASVPCVAIRGPESPDAAAIGTAVAGIADDAVVVALDWPGSIGTDVLGASIDELSAVLADLGVAVGEPAVVELERVEAGRPVVGAEFGEKTIPAETGVVDRSADFTKGCYVGQELVARVDSRGNNTPRTVYPVRLAAGPVPKVGAELVVDGAVVGAFTSVAAGTDHVAALASIKRGVEVPVTASVMIDGVDVAAEVSAPHWS